MKEGWLRDRVEQKERMVDIGMIERLFIYPVKSMRGLEVSSSSLSFTGFEGDRRYAFLQSESKSAFPWLTARNYPEMVLYSPYFVNPDDPKKSPIFVRTPDGRDLVADSEELRLDLEEKTKRKINLLHLGRGAYDAMPVSLLANTTVGKINTIMERDLDIRRFRPNIFVRQDIGLEDFDSSLAHMDIRIGDREDSPQISLDLKDPRCKIPNIDPATGVVDKGVIKTLETHFENLFGLYGTVKQPGVMHLGDRIHVILK